jgi:hypothetical protein
MMMETCKDTGRTMFGQFVVRSRFPLETGGLEPPVSPEPSPDPGARMARTPHKRPRKTDGSWEVEPWPRLSMVDRVVTIAATGTRRQGTRRDGFCCRRTMRSLKRAASFRAKVASEPHDGRGTIRTTPRQHCASPRACQKRDGNIPYPRHLANGNRMLPPLSTCDSGGEENPFFQVQVRFGRQADACRWFRASGWKLPRHRRKSHEAQSGFISNFPCSGNWKAGTWQAL